VAKPRTTDYLVHNRQFWDADADEYQAAHGAALDAVPLAWGAWRVPESELAVLGDVGGLDVLELGCGAAQWSRALAERGARVVGLDQSRSQLRYADQTLPLVCASGEAVPLRGASFDIVFCDHGAMSFCDPQHTVPEAARLLRPGGLLAFCLSSFLKWLTDDDDSSTRKLQRDWFGRHEITWPEGVVEFQLPYGEWIRLLHANGFEIDDLVHLRAPKGAETTYTEFVDYGWSRRWPAEEIWKARMRPERAH
jgi:SAM-dependent methyltransferase